MLIDLINAIPDAIRIPVWQHLDTTTAGDAIVFLARLAGLTLYEDGSLSSP